MNRDILFASIIAFASSGLGVACNTPATPEQMRTVDSMITNVKAAKLTLNELDRIRYDRAAALYRSDQGRFMQRFDDTLDRESAQKLADHFSVLRAASAMGEDHDRVVEDVMHTNERLRALRNDMIHGAMNSEDAAPAILAEERIVSTLDTMVTQVIANYKAVQKAWDDLAAVDSLLANTPGPVALP